ncbi:hypothetical protein M406DRAFT_356632 [Cryphonectria parasitica EP155]|uniref:HMG box domain-containing protein n=1 Tax=Cryphonectria parasitica (strain ATCC 38755 / EP155) TaxID=660469 RepID=A0A9P4Y214_CRYP1|nr:uncharacterized protein M406DRAFT_356632 [Cryphonectria parasitica EP155]KAF3764715.1 hypothetical protein M406DRAFT_356632 [Cryphonectria parasitica EP155]
MARSKKAEEQKQLAPAMQPHPQAVAPAPLPPVPAVPAINPQGRTIDVSNFIRVRDSVYSRLTTIQGIIGSFAADYLTQTNLLLGEPALLNGDDVLNQNLESLLNVQPVVAAPPIQPLPATPVVPAVDEKKERKKRQHDPNAPKRPLTPYFLYMQTARPIIAADLGEGVPKGAVQEEGQRRWASMSAQEKLGWNQAYQYNLRLYNARVHSYKAGNVSAKEMSDEEAVRYCEEFNIPMPPVGGVEVDPVNDSAAIAEQLQHHAAVPAAVEEPTSKTPKAKASRKRKSEVEPAQATPAAASTGAASPDKKRKRTTAKPAVPSQYDHAIDPALFQFQR